jgi:tetratricopeptide (TPR) repeat protein
VCVTQRVGLAAALVVTVGGCLTQVGAQTVNPPPTTRDEKACAAGDGKACLAVGRSRSRAEEFNHAFAYYKLACAARVWEGCFGSAAFWLKYAWLDKDLAEDATTKLLEEATKDLDKAFELKPDLGAPGLIYRGLIYRTKARQTTSARKRARYLDQAAALQAKAGELREKGEGPIVDQADYLGLIPRPLAPRRP